MHLCCSKNKTACIDFDLIDDNDDVLLVAAGDDQTLPIAAS